MNKLTFSLLLVALFAAVALARTSPSNRSQFKFTPGQTYIYEYRGRQWNGIPKLADQYSGLTLDCDVVLQALPEQSGQEVLMKLTDVQVEELHTQSLDNNDIRKLNQGQEQNQRQMTMYKEELSKPIRFTYVNGKVVRFVAESTDAEWSINIKKSILSLFQLDLTPTKIIKSPRSAEQSAYTAGYYSQPEDVLRTSQETPMVYPIYEESFGGICETLYEVDSVDNVEQRNQQSVVEFNDVLNVTKTVNYKNCLTDPSVSYDRHSFNVNTQTIKGKLFSQEPTVLGQNYYQVPEELKAKYSGAQTSQKFNVGSPVPVERHSYTKYNITTAPQSLVERRTVPVASPAEMNIIESIYSEGKIKYEGEGDLLVSDTQQTLQLITCIPTVELARLAPETSALVSTQLRQPIVPYETIQCELSAQKLKFYQTVAKFSQVQQSIRGSSPSSALYSHKLALPFALSASWYPIVATGQESAEHSIERILDPELLAKSLDNLLVSLAEDVMTEDVAQSKNYGEKIFRTIHIVASMPKHKLAEVHERIVERIQQAKQQQVQTRGKQAIVDNEEVSKAKVVRKLFLDSLPLVGSKQAIEMIENLIETQRVKSWEAKEMCEAVPTNLRYPDTEIIDAFIRISQLPQVRQNRGLFASCSIAVGKMIGTAYAKSKDASYKPTTYDSANQLPSQLRQDDIVSQVVEEADPRRQLPLNWNSPDQKELYDRLVLDEQDLTKYVQMYKQLLIQASQFNEKVIYIETLAHMKVPHVLPILEPFVTGRLSLGQCLGNQPLDIERPVEQSQWYNYYGKQQQQQQQQNSQKDWSPKDSYAAEECNYMRTIAIYAIAHVVHSAPAKVQAMLLPVFDNTYEPYQIRIAAFTSMMLSPVDEHILERIASQMWREPSKDVASFVVGFIDTMSKLTAPKMAPYKQAAMKAAESMPKQYLDTFKFSWVAGGDHFNTMKQTGYVWLAEMIKSNVSSIPRAGYVNFGRVHGQQGSKYDNQFELGFTTKGLESLLKEYIQYSQSQEADSTNLIASIFETLFDAKDDLVKTYRQARDSLKQSILMPGEQNRAIAENQYFFKRQQPIDGVNSQSDKQSSQMFESQRSKRSITIQTRSSTDDDEEAKLTVFSKIFDSTSYHALDKKQIIKLLEQCDDYLKMAAETLIAGGKLHYVKMMMPSNMWHMVPSQLGLPVVVTHRSPIIVSIKIDGTQNGQLTSTIVSQYLRQQATANQQQQVPTTRGFNFATLNGLNITALVHPKIMHSNFRNMFVVEQANGEALGVQAEKSHQLSVPMEVSIAYSQPRELFSLSVQPKTPVRMIWVKEAAKTFIGKIVLYTPQVDNWLGQEHMIRVPSHQAQYKRLHRPESFVPSVLGTVQSLINSQKEQQIESVHDLETPYKFEHRFVQQLMGLELYLEGVSDDEDVVRSMTKPESRGNLQWSSVDEIDEPYQHSKSGPLGEYLHLLDSAVTRPSKYLEFYSTLRPAQSNKSPVYRMDFVLSGKQQKQQQSNIGRRPVAASRLNANQKVWNTIEQAKMNKIVQMQQQQQQPTMMEVY